MDASVSFGVGLTVASGVLGTAQLIFTKLLGRWGYPFFRIHAITLALIVMVLSSALALSGVPLPTLRQFKWLVAMAVCGFGSFLCTVIAVWWGTAPGDVSSLQSINVVVAAILGRLFLSERLNPAHFIAMLCSVVGAVLITKPAFLFGDDGSERDPRAALGLLLAPVSGMLLAMSFVCTRMLGPMNMYILPLSTMVVSTIGFAVLPHFVDDSHTWSFFLEDPLPVAAFVGFNFVTSSLAISTKYMGPKFCPAAVSATLFTASSMLSGYIAQVLLFGVIPSTYTICGAGLMLLAVVAMTLARRMQVAPDKSAEAVEVERAAGELAAERTPSSTGWDDETESLGSVASFIANEFASEQGGARRRPAAADAAAPNPAVFGAVVMGA